MSNVLDVLKQRGYLKQVVYEEELYKLLDEEKVTFYTGYDPTADSLHVGHFVTLMAMAHMQRAGHRPIVLIGGGTAMVGDPSGRTDMRKMMTKETISHNVQCFKKQMARFIDVSDGKAVFEGRTSRHAERGVAFEFEAVFLPSDDGGKGVPSLMQGGEPRDARREREVRAQPLRIDRAHERHAVGREALPDLFEDAKFLFVRHSPSVCEKFAYRS